MKSRIIALSAIALALIVALTVAITGCISDGFRGKASSVSGTENENQTTDEETGGNNTEKSDESGEEPTEKYFTVTFDSQGGIEIEVQHVAEGGKATAPAGVQKQGNATVTYIFKGWYLGENLYDFDATVTEDITLVARWDEEKYGQPLEF